MASIRNITYEDFGVRWDISFEYTDDGQTQPWTLFECQIPSDLQDIKADDAEPAMLELGMAIARGQGIEL